MELNKSKKYFMKKKAFLEIQIDKFGKKNWWTVDSQD